MQKNSKIVLLCFTLFSFIALFIFLIFDNSIPKISAQDKTASYSLVAGNKGIFYYGNNKVSLLWEGKVFKILPTKGGFFFLTNKGILYSDNLKDFKLLNNGIHKKVIKNYQNNVISFSYVPEPLKDIACDYNNSNNLITASKDGVYVSQNKGLSWRFISSTPAAKATGIKSVAIYSYKNNLHIFFGHPYDGVFHMNLTHSTKWEKWEEGLKNQGGYREEVSSLLIAPDGDKEPKILASQNFQPNVYEFNRSSKIWKPIFTPPKEKSDVNLLESLSFSPNNKNLMYVTLNKVVLFSPETKNMSSVENVRSFVANFAKETSTQVNSIIVVKKGELLYSLSELYLLQPPIYKATSKNAFDKRGIYTQTDVYNSPKRLESVINTMKKTNLNMVVIDMKDDWGNLRFDPEDPLLKKMGHISRPIKVNEVTQYLKKQGVYTVARIPVFKDKGLYFFNNNEFAVKDKTTHAAWRGIKEYDGGKIKYNGEFWVDPYNEKVWEYNIHIAKELLSRGFDEIQFDYIRFPTDGKNLSNMEFPSQGKGMDKESALMSFLQYARENINAPISIDIYGANGWLRTGVRTGQDVELLSQYVDVICPMYYPSHFSLGFLNFPPYEDRPYRIYNIGTSRNYYIARESVVIRPYVQAFILTFNKYDKAYYGPEYINKEIEGIAHSLNFGYTFWNSSTKYNILLNTILNRK